MVESLEQFQKAQSLRLMLGQVDTMKPVHQESPALALFENCPRQAAAMELVITEQPTQQGRG